MFYVYELSGPCGAVFYVGKGKGNRMYCHELKARRGVPGKLCNKIRKILNSGGTITKTLILKTSDETAAFEGEKARIRFHGRSRLCNLTDGGDGPSNPTPEVREKIAAGRRGLKASPETRERLRVSHLGKTQSEETKAKISEKQKTIKKPWAVTSGENLGTGFKGRKWSPEHRAKFIKARTGHVVSPETREKISQTKLRNSRLKSI